MRNRTQSDRAVLLLGTTFDVQGKALQAVHDLVQRVVLGIVPSAGAEFVGATANYADTSRKSRSHKQGNSPRLYASEDFAAIGCGSNNRKCNRANCVALA